MACQLHATTRELREESNHAMSHDWVMSVDEPRGRSATVSSALGTVVAGGVCSNHPKAEHAAGDFIVDVLWFLLDGRIRGHERDIMSSRLP
jgi:hypothetical protein